MKKLHVYIQIRQMDDKAFTKTIDENEFSEFWNKAINGLFEVFPHADVAVRIIVDDVPSEKFNFNANVTKDNLHSGYLVKQTFDMAWDKYENGDTIEIYGKEVKDVDGKYYKIKPMELKEEENA